MSGAHQHVVLEIDKEIVFLEFVLDHVTMLPRQCAGNILQTKSGIAFDRVAQGSRVIPDLQARAVGHAVVELLASDGRHCIMSNEVKIHLVARIDQAVNALARHGQERVEKAVVTPLRVSLAIVKLVNARHYKENLCGLCCCRVSCFGETSLMVGLVMVVMVGLVLVKVATREQENETTGKKTQLSPSELSDQYPHD